MYVKMIAGLTKLLLTEAFVKYAIPILSAQEICQKWATERQKHVKNGTLL